MLWIIAAVMVHVGAPFRTRLVLLVMLAAIPVIMEVFHFTILRVQALWHRATLNFLAFVAVTDKELAYSAKQFEESYSIIITGSAIEILLNIFLTACLPDLVFLAFVPIAFWVGVVGLRLYTTSHTSKRRRVLAAQWSL